MNKLRVGLVQINNSFSGQNYLPYALGLLKSYFQTHSSNSSSVIFSDFIYKREPISNIVESLSACELVGFSLYVWNEQISLEIARRLKQRNSEIIIVFGGPQVPDDPSDFFIEHSDYIDFCIHNEGEKTFQEFIDNVLEARQGWEEIPGLSYFIDGACNKNPSRARINDLTTIPSPFLSGIFDDLMAANPEEKWIGLWETNRGCPFKCSFCDWGSATAGKVYKWDEQRLQNEVSWFSQNKIDYIFVCDANFGALKRDIWIAEKITEESNRTGYPKGFSVQSTKNATERAYLTQKILSDAGLNKGVALSMQSLDKKTLEAIKRDNISLKTYFDLSKRFSRDGVETYSDLILGLPNETTDTFLSGVAALIDSGQHNRIQFNNLSILPNAEMGSKRYQERYHIKTVENDIINIHGSKNVLTDDVPEKQLIVIKTNSMSERQWSETRALAWLISFSYFNKLLMNPILVIRSMGVPYDLIFEKLWAASKSNHYPFWRDLRDRLVNAAKAIQQGKGEYAHSKEYLDIYWPIDELMYIELSVQGYIKNFYSESRRLFEELWGNQISSREGCHLLLSSAFKLNEACISTPSYSPEQKITFDVDVLSFIEDFKVAETESEFSIDRYLKEETLIIPEEPTRSIDDWCREVVWWGNKKGAYLRQAVRVSTQPILDGEAFDGGRQELSGHY